MLLTGSPYEAHVGGLRLSTILVVTVWLWHFGEFIFGKLCSDQAAVCPRRHTQTALSIQKTYELSGMYLGHTRHQLRSAVTKLYTCIVIHTIRTLCALIRVRNQVHDIYNDIFEDCGIPLCTFRVCTVAEHCLCGSSFDYS